MKANHLRTTRLRAVTSLAGAAAVASFTLLGPGTAQAAPQSATAGSATVTTSATAGGNLSPDAIVSTTGAVVTPAQAAASVVAKQGRGAHGSAPSSGAGTKSDSVESIIGPDDRFRVQPTTTYPASATVLILRNGQLHCTGWMISKDTMLTAGHCVHTGGSGGSWYSGLTFKPGSNKGSAPFGTYTSRGTYSLVGWVNSGNWEYDAAIVKLSGDVGNTVGWFGMWWQSASLDGLFTRVSGYPGDKPKTQWMSYDVVRATETNKVYYRNDTLGGMSGSPVWQYRASGAAFCGGGPCAMAIHAYGVGGSGPAATNNSGTRITEGKFTTFMSIVNQP